jgi:hypothetical protein
MGEAWVRHFDQTVQAWYYHNTETGETRWEDNDGGDTAGEGVAEEEAAAAVDEWRGVYVIRYDGGGPVFKHWALYVVDKVDYHAGSKAGGNIIVMFAKEPENQSLPKPSLICIRLGMWTPTLSKSSETLQKPKQSTTKTNIGAVKTGLGRFWMNLRRKVYSSTEMSSKKRRLNLRV